MPRQLHLDRFKESIIQQRKDGATISSIIEYLRLEHGISVSRTTLTGKLSCWDATPKQVRTVVTDQLRQEIRHSFLQLGLSDKHCLARLEREGFRISLGGLRRLRKEEGLVRRLSPDQIQQIEHDLRLFFKHEQYRENVVKRMGRGSLRVHMRQSGFVASRNVIRAIYGEFHQDAIDQRRQRAHRRRGGWTCPGPDYYWCVDGYCKLSPFGIDAYGGIDAYSRNIIWFYVGTNVLTARSVIEQYMSMVDQYNYVPLLMRADRGTETTLIAAVHYWLSAAIRTSGRSVQGGPNGISPSDPEAPHIPLLFDECWSYGKSTQNVKIESWWGRMCEGRAMFWIVSSLP
jgi:hypothetical protein